MKKAIKNPRKPKYSKPKAILLTGSEELDQMISDLMIKFPMLSKRAAIVRYALKRLHRKEILNEIDPK